MIAAAAAKAAVATRRTRIKTVSNCSAGEGILRQLASTARPVMLVEEEAEGSDVANGCDEGKCGDQMVREC